MMTETSPPDRVYIYRIGPFLKAVVFLLIGLSLCVGLIGVIMLAAWLAGSSTPPVTVGMAVVAAGFGPAGGLTVWVRRNRRASGTVAVYPDRIQRPMTRGDALEDYIPLWDVVGMEVQEDHQENGPALILRTSSGPIAYKAMYFDSYAAFGQFRDECLASLRHRQAAVEARAH